MGPNDLKLTKKLKKLFVMVFNLALHSTKLSKIFLISTLPRYLVRTSFSMMSPRMLKQFFPPDSATTTLSLSNTYFLRVRKMGRKIH